jgi:hypothetical protein
MSRYIDADRFNSFGYDTKGYDFKSFDAGVECILKMIDDAPTVDLKDILKSQWISPKKQLPKGEQDILLWYSNHHCIAGYYDAKGNWWRYGDDEWMKYREDAPKYWMGLPEMPVPQEDD